MKGSTFPDKKADLVDPVNSCVVFRQEPMTFGNLKSEEDLAWITCGSKQEKTTNRRLVGFQALESGAAARRLRGVTV
jgi:hypothetical protein